MIEPIGPGLMPGPERTLEFLEDVAVQAAKELAAGKRSTSRKRPLNERILRFLVNNVAWFRDKMVFDKARAQVKKLTLGNYPAPFKIIDAVKAGIENGFAAGSEVEAKGFAELTMVSSSCST